LLLFTTCVNLFVNSFGIKTRLT